MAFSYLKLQLHQKHLKYSSRHDRYALSRLFFDSSYSDILITYSLYSFLHDFSSIEVVEQLVLDSSIKDDPYHIVGSCNGLICICSIPAVLTLWNPCTQKAIILPFDNGGEPLYSDSDISERINRRSRYEDYAFGCDEPNDDYKVVKIYATRSYPYPKQEEYVYALGVYSLNTKSWKSIDGILDGFGFSDSRVLVNGNLHWRSYEDGLWSNPVIMSLNLEAEKYGKIAVPDDIRGEFDWHLKVVEGYLSIVCTFGDGIMDIWIMKEYGVLESWTKVALIAIPNSEESFLCRAFTLFVLSEGRILFKYFKHLVLYDTRNHVPICVFDIIERASLFTESLVSL